MEVMHRGKLKQVELTIALGDLFDSGTAAMVNSEQTDFVLARVGATISGQIRQRYGGAVQAELDAATGGQTFRAGTVIETSGGDGFDRIFHAGFHDPMDWPHLPGCSSYAEYFEAVGSCIRQILESARAQKLPSVAFPLIGCGVFGLDERLLVAQFLDAVEALDDRMGDDESLSVWLVIRERDQFDSVVGYLFAEFLRHRRESISLQMDRCGVAPLDRFAERLSRRSNEDWIKWQLCRYAEIALDIMCWGLILATAPKATPETLFDEGNAAVFGTVRKMACDYAGKTPSEKSSVWGASFFSLVLRDKAALQALEHVNAWRNSIAHGKACPPVAEVRETVARALSLHRWAAIPETDGPLDFGPWAPWVTSLAGAQDEVGLFERWQRNDIRYLVPETGTIVKVPRRQPPAPTTGGAP